MIIRQLKLGRLDNFTYILGCERTKQALVIDPAAEPERIVVEAKKAALSIQTILNTHGHSDHTAENKRLKQITGARIVMHRLDAHRFPDVDRELDNEATLWLGEIVFEIIHTPGHTRGGICLLAEGNLFTGDTLFVDYIGRIDLSQSDPVAMARSLKTLMALPDETVVWPGHDYGPTPTTTIGKEKLTNKEVQYMLEKHL
jgi:glyoxylase-like metal-dependent hydrolase (beta-lactamase superfamily II)